MKRIVYRNGGHDFRPSYRNILNFTNSLRIKPIISAFTATATPEVKTDIINLLGLKQPNVFVTGLIDQIYIFPY